MHTGALNRVLEIDHPSPLGSEYFEYDVMGTLVGKKDGEGIVTAYEYDELNRLTKVDYDHDVVFGIRG